LPSKDDEDAAENYARKYWAKHLWYSDLYTGSTWEMLQGIAHHFFDLELDIADAYHVIKL
jgi:hypothetical protein